MARKLKVFRTAIGFHDAYVAAPSQKAALEAWGSTGNLFATGAAELVTDDDLTKAPLSKPGKVVTLARGSADEHMAALTNDGTSKRRAKSGSTVQPRPTRTMPRPDRTRLDEAEKVLSDAMASRETALAEIDREERALRDRRRKIERENDRTINSLEADRDKARSAYERALERWRRS